MEQINWAHPAAVALLSGFVAGIVAVFSGLIVARVSLRQQSREFEDRRRWRKLEAYAEQIASYLWMTDVAIRELETHQEFLKAKAQLDAGTLQGAARAAKAADLELLNEVSKRSLLAFDESQRELYRNDQIVRLMRPKSVAMHELLEPPQTVEGVEAFRTARDAEVERILKTMREDIGFEKA